MQAGLVESDEKGYSFARWKQHFFAKK